MRENDSTFRLMCEREFNTIRDKLDRLDEAIRGNGRLGIVTRLDRLEQSHRRMGRLTWMLIGTGLTAGASVVVMWVTS